MKKSIVLAISLTMLGGFLVFTGDEVSSPPAITSNSPTPIAVDKITVSEPAITTEQVADQPPADPLPPVVSGPLFVETSPGQYVVYDKQAAMDAAGIPAIEQQLASDSISRVSNWNYGNFLTLCIRDAGPSSISNIGIRKSQAAFGPTVFTDPVIQLKWCYQWKQDHSLSWDSF